MVGQQQKMIRLSWMPFDRIIKTGKNWTENVLCAHVNKHLVLYNIFSLLSLYFWEHIKMSHSHKWINIEIMLSLSRSLHLNKWNNNFILVVILLCICYENRLEFSMLLQLAVYREITNKINSEYNNKSIFFLFWNHNITYMIMRCSFRFVCSELIHSTVRCLE